MYAVLSWMERIKEMIGDGIVDMESTLKRIIDSVKEKLTSD